jgi:outer membrane protein insertion porin family
MPAVLGQQVPPEPTSPQQPPPQPQPAPIVRQIEIQYAGPATLSRQRILSNMKTTVGQPYSELTVEDDIRSLYATGLVTNVRIYGEPLPDGVKVIVVVQTRVTLTEILIQGAEAVSPRRVRRELALRTGTPLDEQALEQSRQKLVELYQKRGFPDVDVQYKVDVNDERGTARVTYSISEGGKAVIRRITFVGNTAIKSKVLRKEMKTKQKNIISLLTGAGRLNSRQLDEDVQKVREVYQNAGYADVQVTDVRIERVDRKNVDVVIYVQEGPQYHVNQLSITGLNVVQEPGFRKVLKVTEGQVFSPQGLQKDIKAVEDAYGVQGYADAKVIVTTQPAGPGLVNLQYRVEEGIQSYVERINISGNTRTKDKVIRRELVLSPGDVFDTVRVEISKKRLEGLQYFERVDTYASDTLVPGRKDLNVILQEKRTGSLNFGLGFSSTDGLVGFGELSQGNFDITNWKTFTGAGQKFRLRAQLGTERRDFILALTEPYFLDQRLSLGGELFYRDSTFYSDVYSQRNLGGSIFLRKPITNFLAARLEYRLENVEIYDVSSDASDIIRDASGSLTESRVTGSLTYDRRDNAYLTRKGTRIEFSTYVTGGPLGGDVQIYGFNFEVQQYFHLPFDTILLLNAETAAVDNWGGAEGIPIYDRLYLGGASTLRGFQFRDVGPKDEDGEAIGGGTMARFTIEYTIPVVDRVRAAVFYDVGFVNEGSFDWSTNDINSDVGIGVRLDLPIGPIRLDYGIPLQTDRFNDSSGQFQFSVGYQF